ncbi:DUF1800 domain-containing protein [Gluconobacter wancherniae]|uniref:DUF1800 domain-containing protein n=1 Tax=Gluconobacter wancherniae TaxID=1307955 RepID=UPI001B8AD848|nr:DUF1800 domain-containing protein [Gluconobacter wancherniae]MBS1063920.1 DUF1800 domain-containing protein [Gluconobacter wancherniae]
MRLVSAINRFGWGQRDSNAADKPLREWLSQQLDEPDAAIFMGLVPCSDGLIALREQRKNKMQGDPLVKPIFQAEVTAQLDNLLVTAQPFRERLAWFWFNHFTVSLRQGGTRSVIGAYMREAIRPHVTGRFSDMLLAVMRHPAMLMYLDNVSSVGPFSPAGRRNHHGLNENLARECLELHTVSPAAGYSQADVTSFAAILTGWSIDMKAEQPGFVFREKAHEPGVKTMMGQDFPEGEDGGLQALHFLGTHPQTYRHIASQMVRHFLSDTPSPQDINHLTGVLGESEGNLREASVALADLHDRNRADGKFRSPLDYATAVMRALSIGGEPGQSDEPHAPAHQLHAACASLGQPLWTAPLPNGWGDTAADWSAPADMLARADWAWRMAAHVREGDPMEIASLALGPQLRPQTRLAMRHAGSRQDALTLLFSSPEFQRR